MWIWKTPHVKRGFSAHYRLPIYLFRFLEHALRFSAYGRMGISVSFVLALEPGDDDHHLGFCVRYRREVAVVVVVSRCGNQTAAWQLAFPLPLIINFSAAFFLAHSGIRTFSPLSVFALAWSFSPSFPGPTPYDPMTPSPCMYFDIIVFAFTELLVRFPVLSTLIN